MPVMDITMEYKFNLVNLYNLLYNKFLKFKIVPM